MKQIKILLAVLVLVVASCAEYTVSPHVEVFIYNAETLKPEANVQMTIGLEYHGGGRAGNVRGISDSLGFIQTKSVKSRYFFPRNSMEGIFLMGNPIVFEKEGYLNDTIYLEYDMLKNIDGIRYLDTMYIRLRKAE